MVVSDVDDATGGEDATDGQWHGFVDGAFIDAVGQGRNRDGEAGDACGQRDGAVAVVGDTGAVPRAVGVVQTNGGGAAAQGIRKRGRCSRSAADADVVDQVDAFVDVVTGRADCAQLDAADGDYDWQWYF